MKLTPAKCAACGAPVLLAYVDARPGSSRRLPFLKLSTIQHGEAGRYEALEVRTGDTVRHSAGGAEREVFVDDAGAVWLEHVCRKAAPEPDRDRDGAPVKPRPCRSCGRPILWLVTPAGKRCPVDPEPHEGRVVEGQARGDRVRGFNLAGESLCIDPAPSLLEEERATVYVSHFATCPTAAQHRKARTR